MEVLQNMFTFLFAGNRNLKCSDPDPGWMKCTKVALFLKYDKEEHARDYRQQDSSKEKKKKWREHQIMLNSLFTALQGISGIPKNLVAKFWTKTEH